MSQGKVTEEKVEDEVVVGDGREISGIVLSAGTVDSAILSTIAIVSKSSASSFIINTR